MKRLLSSILCALLLMTSLFVGKAYASDEYYVNQGTPIYSSDETYFTFPNASVTLTSDLPLVLSITVSKGSVSLADGTDTNNATTFYDMENNGKHKSINFFWSSGVSKDVIETILKALKFTYEDGMTITITMDGNETNIANKLSGVSGATLTQWEGNGHYYLYVPYKQSNDPKYISWSESYNAALEYKIGGRQGYLATLAEVGEQDYLSVLANSNVWVGGTALVLSNGNTKLSGDTISLTEGVLTYASGYYDAANAYKSVKRNTQTGDAYSPLIEYYYWACGPEAGNSIASSVKQNSIYNSNREEIITLYNNSAARLELNGYPQGSSNIVNYSKKIITPFKISNDKNQSIDGEYENCTALYVGTKTGLNDITEGNFYYKDETTTALGYIVEFGDWTGHDSITSSKVASFNITLKNSDNSNPKTKLDSSNISVNAGSKMYDRTSVTKSIINSVTINSSTTLNSDDYTVKYYDSNNNEIEAPKNAGTYKLKVFIDNGTYVGESDYKEFTISQREILVSGLKIKDKQYDGTVKAEKSSSTSYTTSLADGTEGIVPGDNVGVDDSGLSDFKFDSAEKGTNKNVTYTGSVTLIGEDASNYKIASNGQPKASASIVDPSVDVDGKVYDGTPVTINKVTRNKTDGSSTEVIEITNYSYEWIALYPTEDGSTFEYSLGTNAPSDAGNYKVKVTIPADGDYSGATIEQAVTISPASVKVTISPKDKEYDGTTTVNGYTYIVDSMVAGNKIAFENIGLSFEDSNIGNNKTVTQSYYVLTSDSTGNYKPLIIINDANITKRNITVKADDISVKVNESYDYSYTITSGSILSGDTLNITLDKNKPTSIGTYDIKILDASINDNYNIKTINGKLTISNSSSNTNTNTNTSSSKNNTSKALSCEDAINKNWTWSEENKACVYKVNSTGTK